MSTYFVPGNIRGVVGVHNTGGKTKFKCNAPQTIISITKDKRNTD